MDKRWGLWVVVALCACAGRGKRFSGKGQGDDCAAAGKAARAELERKARGAFDKCRASGGAPKLVNIQSASDCEPALVFTEEAVFEETKTAELSCAK